MNRITFFSMAMALAPLAGMAQEQGDAPVVEEKEHFFTLSGQLRPRFEYRNGAYQALQEGEEPAILVNNRLRLNYGLSFSPRLAAVCVLATGEYLGTSTTGTSD